MKVYGAPSPLAPPAPISPQSSHAYDLAKTALVFGLVIMIVILKKLANYFMHNQHTGAEPAGPANVQPQRLRPADPEGIDLELSVVLPACN
jgi:hypothetical protein